MIKLHDGGAYLVNGTEIIPDNTEAQAAVTAKTGKTVTKQVHMIPLSRKSRTQQKQPAEI